MDCSIGSKVSRFGNLCKGSKKRIAKFFCFFRFRPSYRFFCLLRPWRPPVRPPRPGVLPGTLLRPGLLRFWSWPGVFAPCQARIPGIPVLGGSSARCSGPDCCDFGLGPVFLPPVRPGFPVSPSWEAPRHLAGPDGGIFRNDYSSFRAMTAQASASARAW